MVHTEYEASIAPDPIPNEALDTLRGLFENRSGPTVSARLYAIYIHQPGRRRNNGVHAIQRTMYAIC